MARCLWSEYVSLARQSRTGGRAGPRARPIAVGQPGAGPVSSGTSHGTDQKLDHWADSLVRGRGRGASEVQKQRTYGLLARMRNRVLREARLRPVARVVDLGA